MRTEFSSKRSRITAAAMVVALLLAALIAIATTTYKYKSNQDSSSAHGDSLAAVNLDSLSLRERADIVWTSSTLRKGETLSTYLDRMDVVDTVRAPIIRAIREEIDPRKSFFANFTIFLSFV